MRDPLPNKGPSFRSAVVHQGSTQHPGSSKKSGKKPEYCWNFNKGIKCKYGKKCCFVEHCNYCDLPAHGVNVCTKLDGKESLGMKKKLAEAAGAGPE